MNLTEKIFGHKDLSKLSFPVEEKVKQNFKEVWNLEKDFKEIKREIRKNVLVALIEKFNNQDYAVIYEEEFLLGIESQPLLIVHDRYLETLEVAYAIESDEPDFLKLRYGIRADYCDKINPKDKIIRLGRDKEYQKKVIREFYPDFESADEIIQEIKYGAENLYRDWEEKPCWLITRYFNSYYGDTSRKEFYLKVLEQGYEKVADYYFKEIENLIRETLNPLMVLSEIED